MGNIESVRDWGYAGDYVEAMHAMLQNDKANEYVVATTTTYSVRQFIEMTFKKLGHTVEWFGEGIEEIGYINRTPAIVIDPKFYRPNEVGYLYGDYKKAKQDLNWEPKHDIESIIEIMLEAAK